MTWQANAFGGIEYVLLSPTNKAESFAHLSQFVAAEPVVLDTGELAIAGVVNEFDGKGGRSFVLWMP